MLRTPPEILSALGDAIRDRRIALGMSQEQAAARAGVGVRTWRRLERDGHATTATLVHVALVLRCEQGFDTLFPLPVASSLDDLLRQQAKATPTRRRRAPRATRP